MHYHVNVDYTINMTPTNSSWLTAAEAARALGVTPATLYAYVSRGFIRSEATPGRSRARRYARDDVDAMRRRTEERRDPQKAAAHTLRWGLPVLESAITQIADQVLYYRGYDVVELARSRSVSEVAGLLWTGRLEALPARVGSAVRGGGVADNRLPFNNRAQRVLATASAADPRGSDHRAETVASIGSGILDLMVRASGAAGEPSDPIDARLADGWRVRGNGRAAIRTALILCADHELNVSTFTSRCVASAGADPYAVVIAGLAALSGSRHGGATLRAEWLLEALANEHDVARGVSGRLRRGEMIEGFGHPLYPSGDPRARALLAVLDTSYARSPALKLARRVARKAESVIGEQPNLDFALATTARVLGLPPGSGLTIFAIGRTLGWIAHAIEQYALGQIIRPRAKYIGASAPAAGHADL